jgi:hypothetical protein
MYARNAASPEPIAIGAVIQISDGAVQTSGVTVRIKPIGVSEADGVGTVAYSTNGIVLYTPTQAETNYTSFVLIATKSGCIPVSITIVTSQSATSGQVRLEGVTHTGAVVPTVTTTTTATNLTNLPSIPAGWITAAGIADGAFTAAKFAAGAFDAVWTVATRTLTAISDSAGITTLLSRIIGTLAAGTHEPQTGDSFARLGVNGAGLTALGDTRLANLDATIASRASQTSVDDIPTVAEFNARTLPSDDYFVVADYTVPLTTLGANAPAGWINAAAIAASALDGKGNWNVGKTEYSLSSAGVTAVQNGLSTLSSSDLTALQTALEAEIATRASQTSVDTIDINVDAIKAKTDSMTFTVAGFIDANLQYINDIQVIGEGVPTSNPWRPV